MRIIALLERADSCYLHEFSGLSRSLKSATEEAGKNLHALSILVESCATISTASVQVRPISLLGIECIGHQAVFVVTLAIMHANTLSQTVLYILLCHVGGHKNCCR